MQGRLEAHQAASPDQEPDQKATTENDVVDADGNIVEEGTGDLQAITEIINRLEGKPSQKITGPDNGPVRRAARSSSSNETDRQGLTPLTFNTTVMPLR